MLEGVFLWFTDTRGSFSWFTDIGWATIFWDDDLVFCAVVVVEGDI